MSFGNYLRNKREEKGISIRKLSIYSGVSNCYISQIESGKRKAPSPKVMKKLAIPLGLTLEEMYRAANYLGNNHKRKNKATRLDSSRRREEKLPQKAQKVLEEFREYIFEKYDLEEDKDDKEEE